MYEPEGVGFFKSGSVALTMVGDDREIDLLVNDDFR
tara:strand:+ start:794 stop:901 length:108 start_codon:yes stop_codon:yes gene_type:complete